MNSMIIDILRIIAAYAVLFGHGFSFFNLTIFKDQDSFFYIQNVGVVILFMLSGFLITFSLENKNCNHDYKFLDFVKQRTIRFLKGYISALIFIGVIDFLNMKLSGNLYDYYQGYSIFNAVGNLCMLQSISFPLLGEVFIPFGSGRQLWTMSVEWWMNLAFAFIYLILANRKLITGRRMILLLALGYVPLLYLSSGSRGGGLTLCFLFGVIAFYLFDRINLQRPILLFLGSILCIVLYGIVRREAYEIYFFILVLLMFIILLMWGNKKEIKFNKTISFLSRSTYMLYLVHYSIMYLFSHFSFMSNIIKFFLSILSSVVISCLFYNIFEKKKDYAKCR